MKRVFSIILALVMIFSLSITAFAEEGGSEPTTGSITVSNATKDNQYKIYKIFDATYSDKDGTKAVAYSVEEGSAGYDAVTSTEGMKFFNYSAETGRVSKKEGVNDSELIAYLTKVVTAADSRFTLERTIDATNETVVFDNLSFGYYLITSTLGSTVTITSNAPEVTVIDKNQKPGGDFKKVIMEGDQEVKNNVAAIDEEVNYKISFDATNYDGDKHILYYQILDTIGESLSVDSNSFELKIGGTPVDKGWLLNNTSESGSVTEGAINNWGTDINEANWYLVYLGNNQFRVTIPWQTNHTITGKTGAYTIAFPATDANGTAIEHKSKYTSPITISLTYSATVENDAPIGGGDEAALKNTANGSWTSANETGTTPIDFVYTEVFGLGILKDDQATGKNLADAKFKIWKDKECTQAVNVTETHIKGVYKLVINNTPGKNEVVTPVNGKVIVLGLDKGTYYLQETEAPDGYNALTEPVELLVGEGHTPFYVFADTNGNVADLRDPDGTYHRNTYDVTHTIVHNSKGVELPSTGGEGATMLITIGSIIAMAFAVLMITQKKMSIYKD